MIQYPNLLKVMGEELFNVIIKNMKNLEKKAKTIMK